MNSLVLYFGPYRHVSRPWSACVNPRLTARRSNHRWQTTCRVYDGECAHITHFEHDETCMSAYDKLADPKVMFIGDYVVPPQTQSTSALNEETEKIGCDVRRTKTRGSCQDYHWQQRRNRRVTRVCTVTGATVVRLLRPNMVPRQMVAGSQLPRVLQGTKVWSTVRNRF